MVEFDTLDELLKETNELLEPKIDTTKSEEVSEDNLILSSDTKVKNSDNRKIRDGFNNFLDTLLRKANQYDASIKPVYNPKIPLISGIMFLIKSFTKAIEFNNRTLEKIKANELTEQLIQQDLQNHKQMRTQLENILKNKITKTIKVPEENLTIFYEELKTFKNIKVIPDSSDKTIFTIYVV